MLRLLGLSRHECYLIHVDILDHPSSLINESWQTSCKLLDLPMLYNDIFKRLGQKFRRMWFSVRQSVLRLLNRHLTSLINCHSEVTNWQYYTCVYNLCHTTKTLKAIGGWGSLYAGIKYPINNWPTHAVQYLHLVYQ